MRQHAQRRHFSLHKSVTDSRPQQHAQQLTKSHQHDDPTRGRKAVTEPLLHVSDRMDIDRRDHHQGQPVADREQPESSRIESLAKREILSPRRFQNGLTRCLIFRSNAIDKFAVIFGTTADHSR